MYFRLCRSYLLSHTYVGIILLINFFLEEATDNPDHTNLLAAAEVKQIKGIYYYYYYFIYFNNNNNRHSSVITYLLTDFVPILHIVIPTNYKEQKKKRREKSAGSPQTTSTAHYYLFFHIKPCPYFIVIFFQKSYYIYIFSNYLYFSGPPHPKRVSPDTFIVIYLFICFVPPHPPRSPTRHCGAQSSTSSSPLILDTHTTSSARNPSSPEAETRASGSSH
eukprot:gene8039-5592_t